MRIIGVNCLSGGLLRLFRSPYKLLFEFDCLVFSVKLALASSGSLFFLRAVASAEATSASFSDFQKPRSPERALLYLRYALVKCTSDQYGKSPA